MRTIGFLTDWGRRDGSVATCKGVVKSIAGDNIIDIVDISHEVEDIEEGAFVLATTYYWFPKRTIFLVVVDPGVGTERKALMVKTKDYFFVAPDNGILSFLKTEEIEKVVEIKNKEYFLHPVSTVFHGRDIFAPAVGWLSRGIKMEIDSMEKENLVQIPLFEIEKKENTLHGKIVFVDDFGNLVANLTQDIFLELVGSSKFKIRVGNAQISHLSETFSDGETGEILALFGGDFRTPEGKDLLTIAANLGNAAETTKAKRGNRITVTRIRR